MQVKVRLYKKNDLDIMVLNYFAKISFTTMVKEMLLAFANHEEYAKEILLHNVNLNEIPEQISTSFEVSNPLIINLLERVNDKNNFIKQVIRHNTNCEFSYYNLRDYDKTKDCLYKKVNKTKDDSSEVEYKKNEVKAEKSKNSFFEQKKKEKKEQKINSENIKSNNFLPNENNVNTIHNEQFDISTQNENKNEPSFDLFDTLLNMTENY